MGILFATADQGAAAPSTTWTQALLGDDSTGSINEISATTVSITAAGTVDPDNGTVAYQSVGSGDIQLICKTPTSYTGTTENFTFFGLQLRLALTGTPIVMQLASAEQEGGSRAKVRTVLDGAASQHAIGVTSYLRPKYLAITYDDTAKEVKFWESTTGTADEYEQIGATLSQTLTYPVYACLYGTSNENTVTATAALSECVLGTSITISQKAPPNTRKIRGHLTFETGALQSNGYLSDGLYTDGFFLRSIQADGSPRTITNITRSSTPVATYTGTLLFEGAGLTLSSVEGMTELEGRLIRVRNPTSTTFDVYQDGNDEGYNPTKTCTGNTRTNTSGYGAFSGSCLAQGWKAYSGNGDTLPAGHEITVKQTTFTPPTNAIGAASAVVPLVGDYFLSTNIYYWKDYSVDLGNLSNNVNNARVSCSLGNGQEFNYNEEEWFSVSWFLPSNYDHESPHDGTQSRNQLFLCDAVDEGGTSNPLELHLAGNDGASYDDWVIDYTTGNVVDGQVRDTVLGSTQNDIGLWTTFVIRMKCHETNGILQIWKSTGADLGGGDRAMTLVFDRTGAGCGTLGGVNGFKWSFRQYKFGWHSSNSTINSTEFWIGWDEFRYGGVNEGTGFADVHPFQRAQP